jgi:DNA-binding MarR family transcriptional regulator
LTKIEHDASSRIHVVTEAGTAMFRLGRLFSRLPTLNVVEPKSSREVMLSAIHAAQTVDEAVSSGGVPTVGTLADRLAVDHSTASRLVTQCVRRGYLRRTARQSDGRAVALELTDAGKELTNDARRYQRAVFERATDDWTNVEREEFARLFVKFASSIATMRAEMVGQNSNDHLNPVPK